MMYTKERLKRDVIWNYLYCYWFNSGYCLYIFNKSKRCCGIHQPSTTVNVTTTTPAIVYCASQGNSTVDEKIAKVVLDQ
jgi:putative hemolysin